MTLVAGISVGSLPAFIGDLLISWRLPTPVELPTQPEGVHPGQEGDHAAGLAQKLVIVRPYFLLAWAGSQREAHRIVAELDRALPVHINDLRNPETFLDILDTCQAGTELVVLFLWTDGIYPFGVRTRGFELDGRRIYLLGSGAPDFFGYLQSHPEVLADQETATGLTARAVTVRFAARAMVTQWVAGGGLENSWGGGFEIAYPEPDGFRKLDNMLFRAWLVDEDGTYHNSGRSFFVRYYGRDLYLSCFNPDEKTFVVRSPVGEPVAPPEYEHAHPEWTVDVFVMKRNGSFVELARYHPPERPVRDFVELEHGMVVGWNMDRSYFENCLALAIARMDDGNRFELKRY